MSDTKLVINGRVYPMPDPNTFTLGEARAVKFLTGKSLSELDELADDDPDAVAAIVFVAMRREDPKVTIEDVEAIEYSALDVREESPPAEAPVATGSDGADSSPETIPAPSGTPT